MNEAELVLTHVLNCDRLSLYLNKDINLNRDKSALLSSILKRRMLGEPVQYILGETEFMGFKFKVDNRVLIPRPETEILVETAIEKLRQEGVTSPKILDLGTGSGCIAVALAKNLEAADVWASDVSNAALQLAKENAGLNNVEVKFLQSDIFSALKLKSEKFDLIISNPPYISDGDFGSLAKEIFFEPQLALKAGKDGLDFYRRIISRAGFYLKGNGLLMFEVGLNQANFVKEMLQRQGFNQLSLIRDYNNIERIVTAKKGLLKNG
ncbi:MAG: peptide chain release factor N(5)-glutamine methyltransferase [Candidatus Omnitrophota bacterium]|jgi:release factor glutamine methyltransferase|nr:peptide chain release factor N(5)-glutamine methyltransferase [Candidatus Omnitrophota bacterium]